MRKVILYLAANPSDTVTLPELWKEVAEVKREIRRSKYGNEFDFQPVYAASAKDIRTEIVELRPQIVHFSGHGAGVEGIIIESDTCEGISHSVTGEVLQDFFRQFDFVECIMLNACYSTVQAELLHRCVRYVIGIDSEIDDVSAREFSASFYNALANGYSVESAFEISRSYLFMKKKPIECQPRLFKREEHGQQFAGDGQAAAASVLDPFKELAKDVVNLITKPSRGSLSRTREAGREFQALMLQWIAVCTAAFLLAAGISMGPEDSLLSTFRLIALVTMPLLQWMVIKNWMRSVPWWQWFFGTAAGAVCGWFLGEAVSTFVSSEVLHVSYLGSSDLACWYEDCVSDQYIDFVLTMLNLVIDSLFVGVVCGGIQGWLLQRSFLRIRLHAWVFATAAGLVLGSMLGLPAFWYSKLYAGANPDDFVFALLLGATYGVVTGRVLLSYTDMPAVAKPAQSPSPASVAANPNSGFESRYLASSAAVPAQLLNGTDDTGGEISGPYLLMESRFVSCVLHWLDGQRVNPRAANWSLAFAVLAAFLTLGPVLWLIPALSVVASIYFSRVMVPANADHPRSDGKKRMKVARILTYIVLIVLILSLLSGLFA